MKKLLLLSLLTAIIYSCEKTEPLVDLNTNENLSFIGTFQTSENFSGTIILNISKGHYECITICHMDMEQENWNPIKRVSTSLTHYFFQFLRSMVHPMY